MLFILLNSLVHPTIKPVQSIFYETDYHFHLKFLTDHMITYNNLL